VRFPKGWQFMHRIITIEQRRKLSLRLAEACDLPGMLNYIATVSSRGDAEVLTTILNNKATPRKTALSILNDERTPEEVRGLAMDVLRKRPKVISIR
jgi:hypothetical protein